MALSPFLKIVKGGSPLIPQMHSESRRGQDLDTPQSWEDGSAAAWSVSVLPFGGGAGERKTRKPQVYKMTSRKGHQCLRAPTTGWWDLKKKKKSWVETVSVVLWSQWYQQKPIVPSPVVSDIMGLAHRASTVTRETGPSLALIRKPGRKLFTGKNFHFEFQYKIRGSFFFLFVFLKISSSWNISQVVIHFLMYTLSFCYAYMCMRLHVCARVYTRVPLCVWTVRRHWVVWSWSFRRLWTLQHGCWEPNQVLASALPNWAITPAPWIISLVFKKCKPLLQSRFWRLLVLVSLFSCFGDRIYPLCSPS